MNVEIPCQSFEIYADIKFHENAPGVVGGGGELFLEERRTDTTKVIVAFRSSSNTPKNISNFRCVGKTVTNLN